MSEEPYYKRGDRVWISKLEEAPDSNVPAADENEYRYGEVNHGVSVPVGYYIEGVLIEDIVAGHPVQVSRESRNGVECRGHFMSSPVVNAAANTFSTANSVYIIMRIVPEITKRKNDEN